MKKNKGFTIIEMLIVVGVTALIAVSVFYFYLARHRETVIVNQISLLKELNTNIQKFARTTNNLALITPINLINANIPPLDFVNMGVIRHGFNGNITFAVGTSMLPNDSIDTIIPNLPNDVCTRIVSSSLGEDATQIVVNGSLVRSLGTPFNSVVIAGAALNCVNINNTVILREVIEREFLQPGPGGTLFLSNTLRQRNPYHVPTLGNVVTSPAVTCLGGSTWNGSFCSCAAGSDWNGFRCVTHNDPTVPGACALGQGWNNTQTCQLLPSGTSLGEVHTAGRRVPNLYSVIPLQRTVPELPGSCTAPGSFFDGRNCLVCINGATWNGFRCVTNN